jgi:hypothetical protein
LRLTPLVQVSGSSPFAGSTADNPASQPGFYIANSEAEPYVAVNPTNSKNVVATWQQDLWSTGAARGIVAGVSFDGGDTWRPVVIPGVSQVSSGTYQRAVDTWVAAAPNGDFYHITLAMNGIAGSGRVIVVKGNAVLVSKSTDGGLTWSAPTPLIQDSTPAGFDDRATVTADPTNASLVYAVWNHVTNRNPNLNLGVQAEAMFARSTDGGQTWEPNRTIYQTSDSQTSVNIGHQILVRPDGTLIDLFMEADTHSFLPTVVKELRSTDNGLTWSQPITVAPISQIDTIDPETGQFANGSFFATYAVDPHNGNLYAVWADARFSNGQYNSVAFTMSTDGGLTWSAPIRINQTPDTIAIGNRQAFVPAVAVASDGTVAVSYYDFRNNTPGAGLLTDYWLVHADPRDGLTNPVSWQNENRLTNTSFNLEQAPGLFVGDYEGLTAAGKSFYAVWAQPHDSDPDSIFFRDPPPAAASDGVDVVPADPNATPIRPLTPTGAGQLLSNPATLSGAFVVSGESTLFANWTDTGTIRFVPTGPIRPSATASNTFTAADGEQLYITAIGTTALSARASSATFTYTAGNDRFLDPTGPEDEVFVRDFVTGGFSIKLDGTLVL